MRVKCEKNCAAGGAIKLKSDINFIEFPLTGCTLNGNGLSWDCPAGASTPNPGWTQADAVSDWERLEQTNGTSTLRKLGASGANFYNFRCNENGACANVIKTFQKW